MFAEPAWNRNRTLRAGYAKLDAKHHPEGLYYLRFLRAGKRVWESVGREPDAALVALRKTEHELQSMCLGLAGKTLQEVSADSPAPVSTTLEDAIQDYLTDLQRFRAPGTVKGATYMLTVFGARFPGRLVSEISKKDLLHHMDLLKAEGLTDRTIFNHQIRIGALLRVHGIVGLLSASDKPRYEEREVEAYDPDQLAILFAAANPEERLTFEFFLGTGLREQEVMYATWRNVDFKGKVIAVRSKPEMGFRIKDKEERSVPVPDSLIQALIERRKQSSSILIFPGKGGRPNGHFLRTLQKLAFRAGLNCGECITKTGKSCAAHPVCGEWGLHKFRKTFATMHSEAGVSPRTIQRWLGHSDLATTLRYLAAAELRSERTRTQVNATFAQLKMGGGV
jgi:integrase